MLNQLKTTLDDIYSSGDQPTPAQIQAIRDAMPAAWQEMEAHAQAFHELIMPLYDALDLIDGDHLLGIALNLADALHGVKNLHRAI